MGGAKKSWSSDAKTFSGGEGQKNFFVKSMERKKELEPAKDWGTRKPSAKPFKHGPKSHWERREGGRAK